jgi:hypothetical protein
MVTWNPVIPVWMKEMNWMQAVRIKRRFKVESYDFVLETGESKAGKGDG